jgi:hypothetical protein
MVSGSAVRTGSEASPTAAQRGPPQHALIPLGAAVAPTIANGANIRDSIDGPDSKARSIELPDRVGASSNQAANNKEVPPDTSNLQSMSNPDLGRVACRLRLAEAAHNNHIRAPPRHQYPQKRACRQKVSFRRKEEQRATLFSFFLHLDQSLISDRCLRSLIWHVTCQRQVTEIKGQVRLLWSQATARWWF